MVRCQGKENKRVWSRTLHLFVGDFTEIQIEGRDFFTITPQNQKIKNCFAGGHFFLSEFIYRWLISVHRDISCSVEVDGNFAAEHRKKHFSSISDNWCHQDFGGVLLLLQKSHLVFYSWCLIPPSWVAFHCACYPGCCPLWIQGGYTLERHMKPVLTGK